MRTLSEGELFDGRYRIIRLLGHGGMADVYLALDSDLGRQVALKILSERCAADESFLERFRREANAAASLSHPNVVQIYDRRDADGIPYISMELVEGETLKEVIARAGSLPAAAAISYARQILAGLGAAHEAGIVHRDIKPQNVLLGAEALKVTDFGIARAQSSQLTEAGSLVGTASYMSPEQAQGLNVSAATDLYAVGIVLFELLTGRLPFEGEEALAVAMRQISEPPTAPSSLNPRLSPQLDAIVLRALAKNPADRYQNAATFDDALAGLGSEEPTRILAAGPVAPAQLTLVAPLPPTKPMSPAQLGGAIVLVLICLLGGLLLFDLIDKREPVGAGSTTLTQPALVEELVPDLTGLTELAAAELLAEHGFQLSVSRTPSATAPRGVVLRQSPSAGEPAELGSLVNLVVSAGKRNVTVPSVLGIEFEQAEDVLAEGGLQARSYQVFSLRPVGEVVAQSPTARTRIFAGSTVRLNISKGTGRALVAELIGLSEDRARLFLEEAGFTVRVAYIPSSATPGSVVAQNPAAGAHVRAGSAVRLNIAQAVAKIDVPELYGLTLAEAAAALARAGLRLTSSDSFSFTARGTVFAQTPGGHVPVSPGSTVEVLISKGPAVLEVPGLIGLTLAEASERLQALGFQVTSVPVPSDEPEGIVVAQSPDSAVRAASGSSVRINISAGR